MNAPRTLALFFAAVLLCGGAQAQDADSLQVENPALRTELLRMKEIDQEARNAFTTKVKAGGADSLDYDRVVAVDVENTKRLKEIVEEFGWPSRDLVGADGVGAAWLIVQHADHDPAFQEAMLPHVKAAYEAGTLEGQDYALLVDRVLTGQGKPQRYGTQMEVMEKWKDGEPLPQPIEDEANVDRRRAEVGLFPMEEYIQFIKEMYLPADSTQ